jgi:HSP20 family protein
MTIPKWDLFYDMVSLRDRINQLFDDSMVRGRLPMDMRGAGIWSPPVDAWETDKEIIVTAELPGVKDKDISVKMVGGNLAIKGVREVERSADATFNRVERSFGTFYRTVPIPDAVDEKKIDVRCENGVLKVRLRKRIATRTRAKNITAK